MKRYTQLAFSSDLSRLLSAAVVSPDFCSMLLQNPARALNGGYCDTKFALPPSEEALVLSIEAATLQEFASEIVSRAAEFGQGKQRSSVAANARSAESIPSMPAFITS